MRFQENAGGLVRCDGENQVFDRGGDLARVNVLLQDCATFRGLRGRQNYVWEGEQKACELVYGGWLAFEVHQVAVSVDQKSPAAWDCYEYRQSRVSRQCDLVETLAANSLCGVGGASGDWLLHATGSN